ncbi:MAG TPA: PQQ-like beta-propeller repeat protein [Gemmatales bacterium]|nr:PQQ-like beta-propeller repeat protein [Gemmatales bacterium]
MFAPACRTLLISASLFLLASTVGGHELDWPQFRGPQRLARSPETGLLKSWPTDGPSVHWMARDLGTGYSTPTIAQGRIYGMSYRGSDEGVWCLDENNGNELWWTAIGKVPRRVSGQDLSYNDGPRSSPTVDGGFIYVLGTGGELACLSASDGKIKWRKNLEKDLDGKMMSMWGFSESVFIDGDKLICTPGGDKATMVALRKRDGSEVWRASVPGAGGAGYGSVTPIDVGGFRIYMNWVKTGLLGIDAKTGKLLWRYDKAANGTANIPTPIVHENYVFCSTAYRTGSALLKLTPSRTGVDAEQVYFITPQRYQNHHGGTVLLGDYLYGGHGQNDGKLTCIEFKTGEIKWQERGIGQGSCAILYADGMLYCRYQDGTLALVEANPERMVMVSKFKLPYDGGKPSWPHPVISKGKLYIREQDMLMCFNIKE